MIIIPIDQPRQMKPQKTVGNLTDYTELVSAEAYTECPECMILTTLL